MNSKNSLLQRGQKGRAINSFKDVSLKERKVKAHLLSAKNASLQGQRETTHLMLAHLISMTALNHLCSPWILASTVPWLVEPNIFFFGKTTSLGVYALPSALPL